MISQAHAIPYRFNGAKCEVLLITSRRKGRWILPKGNIELGETASQRAAAEAYEEAGVVGSISSEPMLASFAVDPSRAKVYPLHVAEELHEWPEMTLRKRAWFSLDEARQILQANELQPALKAFADAVTAGNLQSINNT